MIVDDEANVRELLTALLTQEGFEVIAAARGNKCLHLLEKAVPDLILMDMMMPGMSGREVIETVRQNPKTQQIKIAVLTSAQFSGIGKNTLKELGVLQYLTKPLENDQLVKDVKEMLSIVNR